MQLLSNGSSFGISTPSLMAFSRAFSTSRAVRKRRARCWFILARGSNAVNGHEEELLRLYLAEQVFDVVEDANKHFLLAQSESCILAGILVGAVMDDAVHVKLKGSWVSGTLIGQPVGRQSNIEAVEFRYSVIGDDL